MSSPINLDETTIFDYLDEIREEQQKAKIGRTAQDSITPDYLLFLVNTGQITDTVTTNPNVTSLSDSMTITDSITRTDQTTGTFLIGTAKIGFSDVG